MIWREDNGNNTHIDRPKECRNSIQGKVLLVDDDGYVCPRNQLLNNGCCKVTNKSTQYSCNTCTEEGCCAVYERCVSCCLNPNKVRSTLSSRNLSKAKSNRFSLNSQRSILETVLERASGRQTAIFATVKDQFELCLAKCRTDSHSVEHENKYKNPESKYCYAFTEVHESQRDN